MSARFEPRPSVWPAAVLFGSVFAAGSAAAQTRTATAPDTIVVEAPSTLPDTPDPTANVHRIPEDRLERARARGESLGRLVDQVAGARVLDLGGPLGQRRLTLRGGAPSQALLVIDGVPIRSPFATGVDLGLVHPDTLSAVEVARGGQGASWGDGALTGALVLDSREVRAPFEAVTLAAGSFGTGRMSGVLAAPAVTAAASYEQTRGDFGYDLDLVGLEPEPRTRFNNDTERASVSVAGRLDVGGGRLDLRAAGAFREAGVPGLAGTPGESRAARETTWHGRGHAGWRRRVGWGDGGDVGLSAYGAVLDIDYRDPERMARSEVALVSGGGDAEAVLGLGGAHLVRVVLSGAGERARGIDGAARGRFAAALSDEWAVGPVLLYGAGRVELVGGQRPALLPRVGARWAVTPEAHLSLAVGRSLRTPTLDELYHPEAGPFEGNPDLISERAWEAELAAGWRGPRLEGQVAAFARRIDDTILYLNRNAWTVRPENEPGAANALGGEAEGRGRLDLGPVRATLSGQVSLLLSEIEDTGDRLPTQPVWSFATELAAGWRALEASTALRGFGETSINLRASEENQVPAYLRWDAALAARLGAHLTLGFEILNLMNDRALYSVNRFPLPGRTFFASLRVASAEDPS